MAILTCPPYPPYGQSASPDHACQSVNDAVIAEIHVVQVDVFGEAAQVSEFQRDRARGWVQGESIVRCRGETAAFPTPRRERGREVNVW